MTTSSTDAKVVHEDGALDALCAALTAQGRQARVVENPDRQPESQFTVDAILDIAGERWAVDHSLLSRANTLQTSISVAEKSLQRPLKEIASRTGVGLYVAYMPQRVADRKSRKANGLCTYYEDLLAGAERAAVTGEEYVGTDGMAQVRLPSKGWGLDWPAQVVLVPFTNTTGSIFIGEEVAAGLRGPLIKKLGGQFRAARAAGLKTMLLLDQIPRPGGSHTVWNASSAVVASVVTDVLASVGDLDALDEVWLRQPRWWDGPPRVCRVVPVDEHVGPLISGDLP